MQPNSAVLVPSFHIAPGKVYSRPLLDVVRPHISLLTTCSLPSSLFIKHGFNYRTVPIDMTKITVWSSSFVKTHFCLKMQLYKLREAIDK